LVHCAISRKVAGLIPGDVILSLEYFVDIKPFRSHYGPGVDTAPNRNEYQDYLLGGKGGQCVRLTTLLPLFADYFKIWEP